jgi:conserved hypothetical protein, ribA/ribD-fused
VSSMKKNVISFWGEHNKFGEFSNFYPSEFKINVDNIDYKFNCSEQAFMFFKALFFSDEDVASEILKETNPKKIKALGRRVKNFNEQRWTNASYNIMKKVVLAKFNQDKHCKRLLLATGDSILVEASPYDKIWGVGVRYPESSNPSNWKGKNQLGEILMTVREELKSQ